MDIVAHIEALLEGARADAARAVARAEDVRELRGLLYEFAARLGTPQISLDDLWRAVESEEERARLQSLLDRSLPQEAT